MYWKDLKTLLHFLEVSYLILSWAKKLVKMGHLTYKVLFSAKREGYIQFTKRVRLAKVLATIGQAHCEVARGSPRQASDYCKKENDWQEFGNLVQPGMFDILEVADMYVILAQ